MLLCAHKAGLLIRRQQQIYSRAAALLGQGASRTQKHSYSFGKVASVSQWQHPLGLETDLTPSQWQSYWWTEYFRNRKRWRGSARGDLETDENTLGLLQQQPLLCLRHKPAVQWLCVEPKISFQRANQSHPIKHPAHGWKQRFKELRTEARLIPTIYGKKKLYFCQRCQNGTPWE